MAEAHAAPHRRASVPVEIGASSLTLSLTCLDSPRRASDILSRPQAGGAGRANGARLDGVARAWPARQKQANESLLRRVPRTNSGIARCPRNRCREPLQIEQKALTKMHAVARNIDFVSVSEKAPASAFAWVAVRVRIICCYASAIPQPICEALAELFSCRPNPPRILDRVRRCRCFARVPESFPPFTAIRNSALAEILQFICAPTARGSIAQPVSSCYAPIANSVLNQRCCRQSIAEKPMVQSIDLAV
jgi:hypothetical protein